MWYLTIFPPKIMSINNLLSLIAKVPFDKWLIAALTFGVLYFIRRKMIKSNIFKDNIIKSKLLKHDVVGAVLNNIDNVHFLINKITNDYQILGTYNVETIHLSLRSLEKIKDNLDKLKVLDNPSLEKEIIDYVDEAQYICSSIYNKENELYEKKKSSEHLLLM